MLFSALTRTTCLWRQMSAQSPVVVASALRKIRFLVNCLLRSGRFWLSRLLPPLDSQAHTTELTRHLPGRGRGLGLRGCVAARGGPSCFNRFNEIFPLRIHAAGDSERVSSKTWQRTGSPSTVDRSKLGSDRDKMTLYLHGIQT